MQLHHFLLAITMGLCGILGLEVTHARMQLTEAKAEARKWRIEAVAGMIREGNLHTVEAAVRIMLQDPEAEPQLIRRLTRPYPHEPRIGPFDMAARRKASIEDVELYYKVKKGLQSLSERKD